MRRPELLVLGGPNSGKTHYAGQLYGRLTRKPGALKLRKDGGVPSDLRLFKEVLDALEDGRSAGHTATGTWGEISLPLENRHQEKMDLRWPDYGGEQLSQIFSERAVTELWRERLQRSEGWVFLVRLKGETTYPVSLEALQPGAVATTSDRGRLQNWDANARLVETLQILLHVAGRDGLRSLKRPRLVVLLSCFDELKLSSDPPRHALRNKLPLLEAFLDCTWAPEDWSVWGLSSLGRHLEAKTEDEDFMNVGPEHHGWVLPPHGGQTDPDLSLPLDWLLSGL